MSGILARYPPVDDQCWPQKNPMIALADMSLYIPDAAMADLRELFRLALVSCHQQMGDPIEQREVSALKYGDRAG